MKALHPTTRTLLLLFLAAALFYGISFFAIEHRRHRLAPWSVTFATNSTGAFELRLDHSQLGITNVTLLFPNSRPATNFSLQTLQFDRPRKVPFALPFGECVFMDTTFQPGTVVIRFDGHEIQLLPRVLTIDHREVPWQAGSNVSVLPATNEPSGLE